MTSRNIPERADLVRESYAAFDAALEGLGDDESWAATGCTGWAVRDLVQHCTLDVQRALVALNTPTTGRPDRDALSYWAQAGEDPGRDANGRRFTRVVASMFLRWDQLRGLYQETARAAVHAAEHIRAGGSVRTQGHVLRVEDLLSTLAVEATVHHLDLIRHLPGVDGPSSAGLAEVRRVLTELWEREPLEHWSDAHFAQVGTGRAALTDEEQEQLGEAARRLPLFS